jgi:hypothetical protein
MKIILKILSGFFLINLLFFNCKMNTMNSEEIKKALVSNDNKRIMEAVYLIGEKRDTTFIKELFRLSYDPRISHQREYLGMSVHQACMGALEEITHQQPPNKITYRIDTTNIVFYKKLLKIK